MRPLSRSLCTAFCLLPAAAIPPAVAQEAPEGRRLSFGTSIGLVAADNPDLTEEGGDRVDLSIGLDGRLSLVRPAEELQLSGRTGLRAAVGDLDSDEDEFELSDPRLSLSYSRSSRDMSFSLDAQVSRSDVSASSAAFDGDFDTIEEFLEFESLGDLTENVQRVRFSTSAALATGLRAPFGVTYRLGVSGLRYEDNPTLEDETRYTAGIDMRADLTPVMQATLGIGYTRDGEDTTTDGDGTPDAVSVDFGLSQGRPAGRLGSQIGLTREDGENRVTLNATGAISRPDWQLSGRAGVTRSISGELALVGGATLTRDMPLGDLSFDLSRRVSTVEIDNADEERGITSLQADYSRALTPLWTFGLDANYARSDALDGGDSESYGSLGTSLSRALTEDWNLSMAVRHRFEDGGDKDYVSGNTVSLSLSRRFNTSF